MRESLSIATTASIRTGNNLFLRNTTTLKVAINRFFLKKGVVFFIKSGTVGKLLWFKRNRTLAEFVNAFSSDVTSHQATSRRPVVDYFPKTAHATCLIPYKLHWSTLKMTMWLKINLIVPSNVLLSILVIIINKEVAVTKCFIPLFYSNLPTR